MLRRSLYPLILASLAALALVGAQGAAQADNSNVAYHFLLGVGGLIGPDEAGAPNGLIFVITGEGDFSVHPKVTGSGGGDYAIEDQDGNVLDEGTWAVTDFISFVSYGAFVGDFPPGFEGGKALFRIHLSPSTGGPGADGVLKVTCVGAAPSVPPSADEGIQLALEGSPNFNLNFGGEEGGQTLFIRQ
jgi:hypothetical protein